MYSYKYPRAALTVDAIVYFVAEGKTRILLIERGAEPYKNKWALPGGFVEMGETLEQSCIRELQEETGLRVPKMQQFKAYDAVDRDPRHRTISVVFSAEIEQQSPVKGGDDACNAQWFPLNQLPELAFDHAQMLHDFFSAKQ